MTRMTIPPTTHLPNRRRRFLTLAGTAVLTTVAGCLGGDGPTDGDDTGATDDGTDVRTTAETTAETDETEDPGADVDDAGNEAGGSCDDLRGAAVPFDPGDRGFPLLFEYPETFEEYNAELNDTQSLVGVQLGHVASAKPNSYPVNVAIYQHKGPTTDADASTNWVTNFGNSEPLDWEFDFDGTAVEVHEDTTFDDPEASMWRFLVPVPEVEGVRGVTVQFLDDRDESDCHDVLAEVARAIVESLRANPEWTPEEST